MKKRFAIAIVLLIVVFGGSLFFHFMKQAMTAQALAAFQPPPEFVSARASKVVHWRPYVEAIGTLEAVNGVKVSSAITGKVEKIAFQSGDHVAKGQLLVQLQDAREQALLKQFLAQAKLARSKYRRAVAMHEKGLLSDQKLDTARANYRAARAKVASQKAVIAKKSINAPFSGQVGIRDVNIGQYISPGTFITHLVQLQPLYINFTLPQAFISKVYLGQSVALDLEALPDNDFSGTITAISPAINKTSRTIQAQATIPNDEGILRPGMFTRIKLLAKSTERKVAVPQTAINYSLFGDSVYVLKPANKAAGGDREGAEDAAQASAPNDTGSSGGKKRKGSGRTIYIAKQVFVDTGVQRGKLVAVSGIQPGVLVVTTGQIKLHPGSRVIINNEVDLMKNRKLSP